MDVKTLSSTIGHISAEKTMKMYSPVTDTTRAQAMVKTVREIGGTDTEMPKAKNEPRVSNTGDAQENFEP
jgi:hypothetical protein